MSQREKLISLIVPVYRVEKYLNNCIESIINQTYKNIDIILVDDGSDDKCPQICDSWAQKDSRIRVIHQTNLGLSGARNTGLSIADGEYICFIDSDDFIHPEYCRHMAEILNNNSDVQIVMCNFSYIDKDEKFVIPTIVDSSVSVCNIDSGLAVMQHYTDKLFGYAWNKLYRYDAIGTHRFPQDRTVEDIYFNAEVFAENPTVCVLEEKLYFYVKREGSILNSGERKIKITEDLCHSIFHLFDVLENANHRQTYLFELGYFLNFVARNEVANYYAENTEVANIFRKFFLEQYALRQKDIRKVSQKRKLFLCRYFLPVYRILIKCTFTIRK